LNITGTLLKQSVLKKESMTTQINTLSFDTGHYFIKINTSSGDFITRKFAVAR